MKYSSRSRKDIELLGMLQYYNWIRGLSTHRNKHGGSKTRVMGHCFANTGTTLTYTCQLSRPRRESHACGLKFSISRRLTLAGQFLTPDWKMWVVAVLLDTISKKCVNSDPCKERKPCVKWINDNSFLASSDFWSEKHWERARVYTRPKTSHVFGRLRTSSEDFRLLRNSSEIFGNDRVILKDPSTPRTKISRLYLRKSWQVYPKGPFTQAIFVAATRCNFRRAKVATSKSHV